MMNKTVLITGSSSGIGKATARYYQSKGWNVAATMRRPEQENELNDLAHVKLIRLDVTDIRSIKQAINETIETFGGIDILINNAAYTLTGCFEAGTPEQIQSLFDVVVFGVMNTTREIIPYFRKRQQGVIVNISSLGGRIGIPLSSFYASAKFAVEGFSESIRFELDKLGIKVKVIEPGSVKTNFANNAVMVRKEDVPSYEETFKKRLVAYEKRRDKITEPVEIAKIIYKASQDRSNRLRYLAGSDARLFWKIRQILPFGIFTRFLKNMAG